MPKHPQDESGANGSAPGPAGEENGKPTFEVGYGRPPLETRFKPGQSGNPKGRRKAVRIRNLKAELQRVYTDLIAVRDGNKTRRISRFGVLVHKQAR